MAEKRPVGALFLRGQDDLADSLGYKRLLWAAETGLVGGPILELGLGDESEMVEATLAFIKTNDLAGLVVAGCPLAGFDQALGRALAAEGYPADLAVHLDLCLRPESSPQSLAVAPGARQSLIQALAVLMSRQEAAEEIFEVSTDVLVLGGGLAAALTAQRLRSAGYGVVLVNPGEALGPEPLLGLQAAALCGDLKSQLADGPGLQVFSNAELISLSGAAGVFTARIRTPKGAVERPVGAAVIAQGPPLKPNLGPLSGPLGLHLGGRVMTLSRLNELLERPDGLANFSPAEGPLRLGLAVGLGAESGPLSLRAALEAARRVMKDFRAEVTLLTGNAKVAALELESLSQKVRAEGAVLVKFTDREIQARLEPDDDPRQVVMAYREEILNQAVRQDFDLLAVDETPAPDDRFRRLAEILYLSVGPDGFLQPDQVGALPVLTPRAGVMVVGPAKGPSDLPGQVDEVHEAVLNVRRLLKKGRVKVRKDRLSIDRAKCALCLTCVRVCPEKAMGVSGVRPEPSPIACTGCGTCAAECPQDAIQILNLGDARYEAEIKAAVRRSESGLTRELDQEILIFACANSGAKAIAALRAQGYALPRDARVVELPCAGKLDPSYLLFAFREGFDGIMILGCFEKACQSLKGNTWASYRAEHVRVLLNEAGLDQRRLIRAEVSASQAQEVRGLVDKMQAALAELGPNPLKLAARSGEFLDRFTVRVGDNYVILS